MRILKALTYIEMILTAIHCQNSLFSIKTPYSFIENTNTEITKPNPQCVVKQLNFVHRHGHRFPSKTYIQKFKKLSKKDAYVY